MNEHEVLNKPRKPYLYPEGEAALQRITLKEARKRLRRKELVVGVDYDRCMRIIESDLDIVACSREYTDRREEFYKEAGNVNL